MADDITLNAGSGGSVVATDEITSRHFQKVKLVTGADGTANDVDPTSNGLPVSGPAAHDAPIVGNPIVMGGHAKAAAPADVSADGDVTKAWFLPNGAQATVLTAAGALIGGDATNGIDVDVTRVTGTVTTATAGDVAHDGGDSGNPVKVGFKARNAFPTAVSNNDRADGSSDLWGRQMTTHIDPAQQITKAFNATSTQTGTDVWSPTSGKKIAVTSVVIGTYATTAARIILWFGDNADTTYTAGTDQLLLAFSAAPSSTSKPGLVFTPAVPIFCTTADRELHCTTDAGISIDIVVHGYEF